MSHLRHGDGGQALADHYSRFRVSERVLLTGHSHQAWPDVSFEAQQRAWLDAATLVDDKWERAAQVADDVRAGFRRLLNDRDGEIALGQNTHELVVRLLSAVLAGQVGLSRSGRSGREERSSLTRPTRPNRPRLLTTDGEFHDPAAARSPGRGKRRGPRIAARPVDSLAERLAAAVDDRTACALVSVLFETAEIVPDLATVARACERRGATLLVDAYHHLNVVPFDLDALGLSTAFVTGGGYKYCQLGEGNAFLRVPPDCQLRPVITGWFSEFGELAESKAPASPGVPSVAYGAGAARFAGATYDPVSHYRAVEVFAFHQRMDLTPPRLREISQHQVGLLLTVQALDLAPGIARAGPCPGRRGGFLAIRTHARRVGRLCAPAASSRLRRRRAPTWANPHCR